MKAISLFSGIGALDLAAEVALGCEVILHAEQDPHCQRVLAARFPGVELISDVRDVRGRTADVVIAGFPCTDLSRAGTGAGLDGERSGLYGEVLRVTGEAQPQYVVIENVPGLLPYRERVDGDLERLGYGCVWSQLRACDVGAPHERSRVFILAVKGLGRSVMLHQWQARQGDLFDVGPQPHPGPLWPTATAANPNESEPLDKWLARSAKQVRPLSPPLGLAVRNVERLWPTLVAADSIRGQQGATTDRGHPLATEVRLWPTHTVTGGHNKAGLSPTSGDGLDTAVKMYVTDRTVIGPLSPWWVEPFMGLPVGWTDPAVPNDALGPHVWPMGRGVEQHDWEPPRMVEPRSVPNRPARIKALGNAVVWQQAAFALQRALGALIPAQGRLFEVA